MSKEQVAVLRKAIDECDDALINLLLKRQQYVEQLVAYKKKSGDAIFVPEREQVIFEKIAKKAQGCGVDPGMAQDILQRIMRDSYARQANMEYPCATASPKSICVIGGNGQLGSLFVQQFARSGHRVSVLESDDWEDAEHLLKDLDLVMIAVPIHFTDEVIQRLSRLPSKTLLVDIASIKTQPIKRMLDVHSGPVLGLHPMFGPGLGHLARQLMLYCEGRQLESASWLLKQFELWGCYLRKVEPQQHDDVMSIVQALRHFVTFVAGWQLLESETDLDQLVNMSSPIYRMELALIGRLFAQHSDLYVDILLNASQGLQVLQQFGEIYQKALIWLEQGERELLIQQFQKVADYFGHWKEDFYQQSDTLLGAFRERI